MDVKSAFLNCVI
jgi:hypothetical protein